MTRSESDRLTPGIATAVVFYISAALMAIAVVGLTIAVFNDFVVVALPFHFGLAIAALVAAGISSTLGAAAYDKMFTWPKGGAADPPPYQRMPNINWAESDCAMMLNYYFIAVAFAVICVGLIIAACHAVILFSPLFHFLSYVAAFVVAAVFAIAGGVTQDRANEGPYGLTTVLGIIAAALAATSVGLCIGAANRYFVFGEVFNYVFAVCTLAGSAFAYYGAARAYDFASRSKMVSVNLFVTSGILAAVGVILSIVATHTIIVSAGFHIGVIVSLGVTAFIVAVYAGLTWDHD